MIGTELRFARFVAFLVAGWLLSPSAFALNPDHKLTQYIHRIWQTQTGLPQTSISAVAQTRDGYIWLGTESGVVRFDGVQFTPIPELERAGLGDIWARSLTEDSVGRVWIVTSDSKLIRVEPRGVKVFGAEDGLPGGTASCVFQGRSGDIWVCNSSGIGRFKTDILKSDSWEADHRKFPGPPLDGCQTRDGTFWIAGDAWIASLKDAAFHVKTFRAVPRGSDIYSMVCRDDGVWIGTFRGLLRFTGDDERLYVNADGLVGSIILSLANGRHGELWIGSQNGVSRYANGRFDNFSYEDGLSQKDVFSLFEDREGSLWVATKHGLNQFLDGPITPFTRKEGLPSNNVGPVLEDSSGQIWIGSLDGGLVRWDGRNFWPIHAFASNKITSLLQSTDGTLWVASDTGVSTLKDGVPLQIPSRGLPSIHIRSLFLDHAGTVWVGTDKGASKYQDGGFVEPPEFVRPIKAPVVAMAETPDHHLLLAVEHGPVYSYLDGKLTIVQDQKETGPPLTNIVSLHSDSAGNVWMATNGLGLRLLRGGRISTFSMRDGLFDNEIYGFASDSKGRLWITGSKGFYSVAKADLLAFANGKLSKFKSSPYVPVGVLRAIQAKRGVSPNATAGRDGKVWFSTVGGLLAYDPNPGMGDHPAPPILIEDATVNGVRARAGHIGKIGPGVENVSFHYTGISFLDPQNMMFRYILEGYDRDWTNAGARREAFYTNLPAGHFRFRVAACAPFVPCSEVAAPAELEVIPHLYQRTWFVLLIAASLLAVVFAAYRLRMAQIENQFSLVVAERTRIARELHDTLIQGFAGITMQLQALSEELPPTERETLSDIISDAGSCLRETRQSVGGLRDEEDSGPRLRDAIVEAAGRISHGSIRFQFDLEEPQSELAAGTKYNLLLLLQEAVLNAVRHSGAALIEIGLRNVDGELLLSVKDNGHGTRQPAGNDNQRHYGIVGMRERAAEIGAELEWNSVPGAGTTVRVRLPDKKSAPRSRKLSQVRTIL